MCHSTNSNVKRYPIAILSLIVIDIVWWVFLQLTVVKFIETGKIRGLIKLVQHKIKKMEDVYFE